MHLDFVLSCYPTWIRTKTSRTRICCTTIILSGSSANVKIQKNIRFGFPVKMKNSDFCCFSSCPTRIRT